MTTNGDAGESYPGLNEAVMAAVLQALQQAQPLAAPPPAVTPTMVTTPLLGLKQPALDDPALITDINDNMAILDNSITATGAATLTNKTLTAPVINNPTITGWTNAQHNHLAPAGAGLLDGGAIGSGYVGTGNLVRETALTGGFSNAILVDPLVRDKLSFGAKPSGAADAYIQRTAAQTLTTDSTLVVPKIVGTQAAVSGVDKTKTTLMLYDASAENWLGLGRDTNGHLWLRAGIANTSQGTLTFDREGRLSVRSESPGDAHARIILERGAVTQRQVFHFKGALALNAGMYRNPSSDDIQFGITNDDVNWTARATISATYGTLTLTPISGQPALAAGDTITIKAGASNLAGIWFKNAAGTDIWYGGLETSSSDVWRLYTTQGTPGNRLTFNGAAGTILVHSTFLSNVDGGFNFGDATHRWATLFAVAGAINTCASNQKQIIGEMDDTLALEQLLSIPSIKRFYYKRPPTWPPEGTKMGDWTPPSDPAEWDVDTSMEFIGPIAEEMDMDMKVGEAVSGNVNTEGHLMASLRGAVKEYRLRLAALEARIEALEAA